MQELVMLGTGHAMVTRCFNTCFLLRSEEGSVLVDCGGGNGLLTRFREAGARWDEVRAIFISHAHTDHLTGAVWAVRQLTGLLRRGDLPEIPVYAHAESLAVLRAMCEGMLSNIGKPFDWADGRLRLCEVAPGDRFSACGTAFTVFDVGSEVKRQYGFRALLPDGQSLVFLGDESFHDCARPWAENADWLMHEAFFPEPRERPGKAQNHGSALLAGQNARDLGARNLILYHTEDGDLAHRKETYTRIASGVFPGRVYMPDDLEIIPLKRS